jgi:hypothetical protein
MGQEASVPQNGGVDETLEEQAKAPPSASNPAPPATATTTTTGRKKLMNAMFRGTQQPDSSISSSTYSKDGIMNGEDHAAGYPPDATAAAQHEPAYSQEQFARQEEQYYPQLQQQQQQQPAASAIFERTASKKGGLGKVATGRGAAIINSMRNLSLTGALRPKKGPVNDWEKQWDEDDDESDGEEESAQPAVPLHHQAGEPVRPDTAMRPDLPPTTPPRAPRPAIVEQDDGLEWDTAAGTVPSEEKPNIQMFMPMLRVLGKGSFGKVRSFFLFYYSTTSTSRTMIKMLTQFRFCYFSFSPYIFFNAGGSCTETNRQGTRSALCHENTGKNPSRQTTAN